MDAALAMLARRAQPAARIRERLTQKFDAAEAERAVVRLRELGVLDDARFAEAFTRDRFERGSYGRERIRAELRRKGVGRDHIEAALSSVINEASERRAAERALQRFGAARRARARNARDAAFRHLIGRGFPLDLVRELVGAHEPDPAGE